MGSNEVRFSTWVSPRNIFVWGFRELFGFVCDVKVSLKKAGVITSIISSSCGVVNANGAPASTPHSTRSVFSSVTTVYHGTIRGTNLGVDSVSDTNVNAPNAMGRCNVVRFTGGLNFGSIRTGRVLRGHLRGVPIFIRGSTGYTTLNRTCTNDNRNTRGFITMALNANMNSNVVVSNGVISNMGYTNNRYNRAIVILSNRPYDYNEGNY